MDKLFEAILLAAIPDQVKENVKKPVILSYNKERGLNGEAATIIVGPPSGVYAGLCTLLPDALRAMDPNDRERQKKTLDSIYKRACVELGIK
jgi:hypothetical protein